MNNTIKKWQWALGIIGIIILIFLLLQGAGEKSVSNFYLIPAGTFSPFHEMNIPTEQNVTGNPTLSQEQNSDENNQTVTTIEKNNAGFQKMVSVDSVSPRSGEGMINVSGSTSLPAGSGVMVPSVTSWLY